MSTHRKIIGSITFLLAVYVVPKAYSWCFILPSSITYGSSTDALAAGTAAGIKTDPDLADVMDGNVILGNLYSVDSFKVTFEYGQNRLPFHVVVPKSHAIGINNAKDQYFLVKVDPIANGTLLNPASDLWAKGNWPYWYTNMISEVRGGDLGGYVRLSATAVNDLPRNPISIKLSNVVRMGTELYTSTQALPNGASEAPFSTDIFDSVPIIEECLDFCDTDGNDGNRPVVVSWTLKRNF